MADTLIKLFEGPLAEAVRRGAHHRNGTERRMLLLPIWQQALHRALVQHQCPCGTPDCFLLKEETTQLAAFTGTPSSFETFLEIFEQGYRRFVCSTLDP